MLNDIVLLFNMSLLISIITEKYESIITTFFCTLLESECE